MSNWHENLNLKQTKYICWIFRPLCNYLCADLHYNMNKSSSEYEQKSIELRGWISSPWNLKLTHALHSLTHGNHF